jgi:molybdopterin-containing oxidoreductase family iron-sulfur binding subunit
VSPVSGGDLATTNGNAATDGRAAIEGQSSTGGTNRREFLKVLGVSGAGAATFACGPPRFADKLLPHLVQQEEIVPGVSDTYATVLPDAGPEPLAVHAAVRDGRVLKLEGNPDFPTNRGRLSAIAQSALQDLYDPDRVKQPVRRGPDASAGSEGSGNEAGEGAPATPFQNTTWDEATAALVAAVQGGGTVLLTGAVTGTASDFYSQWASALGAEHIAFETFEYSAIRQAHQAVFGRDVIPRYDLASADRIVGFGADFLGTWLAPVELAAGFSAARDVDAGRHAKFTFVGPRLSITGTNSDQWIKARAGTEGAVALAVATVVAQARGVSLPAGVPSHTPESVADAAGVDASQIRALAEELAGANAAVALPPGFEAQGPGALEAHAAVAILNQVLGAVGRTVYLEGGPNRGETASFADMANLIARMQSGQVRTLIVAGANPLFGLPASTGFAEALGNVANVFALASHFDETAAAATWVLATHHALESWGDAEPRVGTHALGQPLMNPIFDTRQREDILLRVATAVGAAGAFGAADYATYLRAAWTDRVGDEAGWLGALRAGGSYDEASGNVAADEDNSADAVSTGAADDAPAGTMPSFAQPAAPSGTQLVVYPTVQFYDGRGANRSWMQELPDPITRAAWNSWVEMHPDMAGELGVEHGDVVEVRSDAGVVEAPVYLYPGIRPDTVAIPIGQGHTAYGRNAQGVGVNPLNLLPATADPASGALAFAGTSVQVTATGEHVRLIKTQGNDTDLDREIAEVLNIDQALTEIEEHPVDLAEMVEAAWDSDPNSPYRWGMTIDLNSCTGCGACVTACYAENNIPTVGEEQVALRREMSWMRVYRFYEETEDDGFHTIHQPQLCQHCGDAPCEPVCPVYATYHNPEGLNVQVYNRCVGTRYCSNNCPYKVRRFNWFEYEFPYPLNLQLNPDITVRSKGVMEKCTFCVQRINRAKLDAKEEGRTVADGEVTTACQQGCPAEAIVFGNLKDPNSRVSQIARGARGYHMLDEIGTRPAITYLRDVTHAHLAETGHGADAGAAHADEGEGSGEGEDH